MKWAKLAAAAMLIAAILTTAGWFWADSAKPAVAERYTQNASLETVRPNWPGTPVDAGGRFVNYEHPFVPKITDLLRWQLGDKPLKNAKKADPYKITVADPAEFLAGTGDGILWLGHASFYIRIDGVSILTDPVFGDPNFITRLVQVPSPLPLIKTVDYVLLSHDHRDHTDENTIREIAAKFPAAQLIGGLRMDELFNDWKIPGNTVGTAGWFQKLETPATHPHIYFVPVRHWSRRGLLDTNWRLWGGYVIEGRTAKIYFGGDSGYGRHYRDVGEVFPAIDHFLVGIGAYEPRWFMEPNHNSPADAVKAFSDIGAKYLVPMHYGTFDLSDEPPSAPLAALDEAAAAAGLTERVRKLTINEAIPIP